MMKLDWITCGNDKHWCSFRHLSLPVGGNLRGVYVIWAEEGDPPITVRVGLGDISKRIEAHRGDDEIEEAEKELETDLLVTWADVPESFQEGVERYLADHLNPLVGERFPDADPIPVNLPF